MNELLQNLDPFWTWLALACIFLAVEVLIVPSGFFLCLGTSAGVVAAVTFFMPGLGWLWSMSVFSVVLVASSLVWWKLLRRKGPAQENESALNAKSRQLIGYRAVLDEAVRGGRGRLRVNDSPWPVEADRDYPAGTLVEVVDVKSITLQVRAVE